MVTYGLIITTGAASDDWYCSYNPYSRSGVPGDRLLYATANLVPNHIGVSDIDEYDAVVAMYVGFATDVFDLPYTAPPVRQGDLPLTIATIAVTASKQYYQHG